MGVVAYEKVSSDDAGDTHVRLRCGHAFHGTCLAMSFRNNAECPVCRDSPYKHLDETLETVLLEVNARTQEIDTTLRQRSYIQRHNPKLQKLNARYNALEKDFQKEVSALEKKRKALVAKAIKTFREDNRDSFEDTKKKLQKHLTKIRSAEWHALCEVYGETEAKKTLELLDVAGAYSVAHIYGHQEIFRKRFWSL
jgi:DNA repair exonuclease SbcCD ATPase subunit